MGFYKGNQVARAGKEVRRSAGLPHLFAGPSPRSGRRSAEPARETSKGFSWFGRSADAPAPRPATRFVSASRYAAASPVVRPEKSKSESGGWFRGLRGVFGSRPAVESRPEPSVELPVRLGAGAVFYRPPAPIHQAARRPGGRDGERAKKEPSKGTRRWILRGAVIALLMTVTLALRTRVTEVLQDLAGFKLRQVKVTGIHFLSEEDVLEASGLKIGSDMFELDIPKASRGVESLGWVEKVYLERRLPQSVLIAVTERKPTALVDSGGLWGLSADGCLLPFSPELAAEDLPILSGARLGADAVGTTRSADTFRPALDFLAFLKKEDPTLYAGLSEVNVSERDQLRTTFLDGLQARFAPGAGEMEMRRMAAVLSDLGSKGLRAESMDFRFKNQVVVRTR